MLWPDPSSRADVFQVVLGDWDRPLLTTWLRADGELALHATLDAGSPALSARHARRLDTWRERQLAAERQRAIDAVRSEERRRNAERMARLADAVHGFAALALEETGNGGEKGQAAFARLDALRSELRAEVAEAEAHVKDAAPEEGPLAAADVVGLEAGASGREITVDLKLTPRGAARLLAAALGQIHAGLPDTLPDELSAATN